MYSTAHKITTLRSATASARLQATPALMERLRKVDLPKGNALEMARAAGIMAAKKTSELIPLCHPLPIDHIAIDYTLTDDAVTIEATVTTVWKTGVEMEALVAVQMAAATIYDMLKPIDTAMSIEAVRVIAKRGGKSSWQERLPDHFRAAVVVTSDGTHAGEREDRSGKVIQSFLQQLEVPVSDYIIIPDDAAQIRETLLRLCGEGRQLIITTGGTGLGPRDVTVEATQAVIEREVPGIMEAVRSYGQQRTPYAMLSRGLAGVRGSTMIVNLPGSSRGAQESLEAIFPALLHAYSMLAGGGH